MLMWTRYELPVLAPATTLQMCDYRRFVDNYLQGAVSRFRDKKIINKNFPDSATTSFHHAKD